jgi:hypothetical protein
VTVSLAPLSSNLWQGVSTDTKPTAADIRVKVNDVFFEQDTTKYFIFDGHAWVLNATHLAPPML